MFTRFVIRPSLPPRVYHFGHAMSCKLGDVDRASCPVGSCVFEFCFSVPAFVEEDVPVVSRESLVSILTRLRAERYGAGIPVGARHLFSKMSRPALAPPPLPPPASY
jgi:hypothetical protein